MHFARKSSGQSLYFPCRSHFDPLALLFLLTEPLSRCDAAAERDPSPFAHMDTRHFSAHPHGRVFFEAPSFRGFKGKAKGEPPIWGLPLRKDTPTLWWTAISDVHSFGSR